MILLHKLNFFMVNNTLIQYLIISLTNVLGIGSITSHYSSKKIPLLNWTFMRFIYTIYKSNAYN